MDRLSPEQLRYLAEAYRSFRDTKSAFFEDFLVHRLVALRLLPRDFDRNRSEVREEIQRLTEYYPPTFEEWLWWENYVSEHSGRFAVSSLTVGQMADFAWLLGQFRNHYGPDLDYYMHVRGERGGFSDFLEAIADKRSGRT